MSGRKTSLYEQHVELGGKMVEFAGWEMPVSYEGIREEHMAVRTHAGVFDVSHMGEVEVEGPGALAFLQLVQAEADDNANIIFGSVVDQSMRDEIRVTVIATGFEGFELLARSPQRVRRRYESRGPRISAEDTDIRKLRVSDDDIDVPGFLKE